jgi:predicted Zn-dependent protease
MRKMQKSFIQFVLLCFVYLFIAACASNPVTGKQDFVMMSEQQELELGSQYHQQVMKQYKEYKNPQLLAYINEIGQDLAKNSHRENLIFRFHLLDSPEVNAFAVPGGYIYITRGIMAYMQNEAQLAGVLGHEIGHVTARHSVRQHAQQQLAGLVGMAVAIGTGNRDAMQMSNLLGGAIISGYGRTHELESDRLGAEYLAKTGYDASKMIDVVGILKDQELASRARAEAEGREPRSYHGLFASHPRNDLRLKEVIAASKQFQAPVKRSENTAKFMRLMNNVTYGDTQSQGIVDGNRFYHKDLNLHIAFPQGWTISNQPTQIVAQNARTNQALVFKMQDRNERISSQQFLQKTFDNFRNGQSVATKEDQAYAGNAVVRVGQANRNAVVGAVYRGNSAFVLVGIGNEKLPARELLSTMQSLRKLNASEKRNQAAEKKIKVVKAKSGDTFAKLAKGSSRLGRYAEQELRLLNGMYPQGEPQVGQLIKVIR